MSNKQKYKDIFIKSLAMDGKKFNENVKYNEITVGFNWSYDFNVRTRRGF